MRVAALALALALSPAWAQPLSDSAHLDLRLELPAMDVANYARPYVAIWLEDGDRQAVANLALWTGNQTDWLKDIRRWWRQFGRYQADGVDGYSSATRTAGVHQLQWDGTGTDGKRLAQGEYTLYVEVVREHGGRDLVRQRITLGDSAFTLSTEPMAEVGAVELTYTP
ncbi:DUF2271 domain-containing protein [Ferrimonas balearica]|uniref:DUF2271 domain-containing protein n=1 Tax=Ferrimonas balearica TaxID=44012 RepID=UPI001C99D4E6|nr:DUF2271 domain-containing protein [Ferrimonas balearica]MBY5991485.1 DUF2271 domain-containing protein [Ferrimonas balearica]